MILCMPLGLLLMLVFGFWFVTEVSCQICLLYTSLGHDGQAGGLAGLDHVQDALGLQTLEGVGRGTGLEMCIRDRNRTASGWKPSTPS